MPRKAPRFWSVKRPTALAYLLRPAGTVYGAIAAAQLRRRGYRSSLPVVCIGNFTVGGAGKTPMAIWVTESLKQLGRRPAFLSRGYGGTIEGPHLVDPGHDTAERVGDEPLLLARIAPAVVSRDRSAGAKLIETLDADVIVMDDGLQNPSLIKDLAVAVIDAGVGIGNGLVIPAGPLRAPLAAQLAIVHAVVAVGPGSAGVELPGWRGPLYRACIEPRGDTSWLRGRRIIAFAGIGRPEKFFETLRSLGADLVETRNYSDHHTFSAADARQLLDAAATHSASLVTTEKDLVRLGSDPALGRLAEGARSLPIDLVINGVDRRSLIDMMKALSKRR